ncbi:MAG: hypothetical protein R3293_14610 [Candidatus Promineifilaceae bacterium]|nr:hypothetical protein [Candidatus Promineifilaceae bacterium]
MMNQLGREIDRKRLAEAEVHRWARREKGKKGRTWRMKGMMFVSIMSWVSRV